MLTKIILDVPRVTVTGELVQVDVMDCGALAERVAMSPHVALMLADALNQYAEQLLARGAGAEIIPLRAEG